MTIIVMTLGRIRIKSLPSTRLRRRRLPMMLRRVAPRKNLPDYGHQRQDCHNDGHLLSSVVRHVAQVGAFGAVVRHLDILDHPSSWVITPIIALRSGVRHQWCVKLPITPRTVIGLLASWCTRWLSDTHCCNGGGGCPRRQLLACHSLEASLRQRPGAFRCGEALAAHRSHKLRRKPCERVTLRRSASHSASASLGGTQLKL